jgi:hypothetical protein
MLFSIGECHGIFGGLVPCVGGGVDSLPYGVVPSGVGCRLLLTSGRFVAAYAVVG